MPVEVPNAPAQVAKLVEVEVDQDATMVTRRKMTVNQFIPGTQPPSQLQGRDHAPPPPGASRPKKKQRVGDQPPKVPSDAPTKTSPQGGIMIREPVGEPQPPAKIGTDVASSSWPANI